MAEVFGIQNLKTTVKFACGFTKQVATALEDGKFQLIELSGFLDEVMEIPGLIKALKEVGKEISDLSETEKAELYEYLKNEFDIPNDSVEAVIEYSVGWVLNTVALYGMFKNLKNPPVENDDV